MECIIEGYLNPNNNVDLFKTVNNLDSYDDIKYVFLKIIDKEYIDKLKNILAQWDKYEKLNIPVYYSHEGGLLVKFTTRKLIKNMCNNMLKTPRKEWFNKKYKVRFGIKKYAFKSEDNLIQGIKFNLIQLNLL